MNSQYLNNNIDFWFTYVFVLRSLEKKKSTLNHMQILLIILVN